MLRHVLCSSGYLSKSFSGSKALFPIFIRCHGSDQAQGASTISTGYTAIAAPLHYVNGSRVSALNKSPEDDIKVLEPATSKLLCTMRSGNDGDVDRAVKSAKTAFSEWSKFSGPERSRILNETAEIVRMNLEEIARTEVRDTGKPIWEARFDIEACASTIEYFGGVASTLRGDHIALSNGNFAYTRREPVGVCGGIGAWNYPFQMAVWKSAPALACGNTMVFKPSSLTPLTAVMLAEAYTSAGLPSGCFNVIQGGGITGDLLTKHSDISKMSFTGSVKNGTKVYEACAKDIKKVTLELGGKSPLIIFEDADIERAVKGTMMANFLNQGQVCSNGTRVYVSKEIYPKFINLLVAKTKTMKIGDPMKADTTVGAMISEDHSSRVLAYIQGARDQGAKVLCGGTKVVPDQSLSRGHYISPCILTDVTDDMTVAREEVFGPVCCVFQFQTEEEVIRRANDSEFGLAGGVFTKDLQRAHRVAASLEAGNLYINNYNIYPTELPFGGYKKSGIGRENGLAVTDHYTQLKTVYVEMGDVWCPL